MANIFARSPYIVRIAQPSQIGSKLEIFISAGSFSIIPTYTLSKLIPSPNNVETLYNISPYIREHITFLACSNSGNFAFINPPNERVNVQLKLYWFDGTSYAQVGTTQTHIAFDGYTYYEELYNKDLGNYGLDAGNYYYNPTSDAGKIRVTGGASFTAKYTNLSTGTFTSLSISNGTFDIPRVRTTPNNLLVGNKVEILDAGLVVQATWNFYPLDECKYAPVTIDFVNRYGAWQREFFFKASNDNFNVENTEYNLMQTSRFLSSPSTFYSGLEGQRKTFNTNGKKSIKVNTGWVKETWKDVLKQIMLSERILIDNKPAKINTKSTELFKQINTKQINYSLEFDFAYDVINSVI
jgi:hypothetical protein